MDSSAVRDVSAVLAFEDGLGRRYRFVDPAANDAPEMLCFRGELAAVPSFEQALRERVSRLAGFHHPNYSRIRSVGRLHDLGSTLALVSEYPPGMRLSTILAVAERKGLVLDINAALCVIRQLLPAVAVLHQGSRNLANGALGPERIVITPDARLVIVEFALGPALEELRFSHERYWKDLRIALPPCAGLPRFDQRTDVTQLGVVALSLILGRSLKEDEYPSRVEDVVASARASSADGDREPLEPALRSWLMRALQLDVRNAFGSVLDAQAGLDQVLAEDDYLAAPAALETVLSRLRSYADEASDPLPVSRPSASAGHPGTIGVSASMPAATERGPWPRIAPARVEQASVQPVPTSRFEVLPVCDDVRLEITRPESAPIAPASLKSLDPMAVSDVSRPSLERREWPHIEMSQLSHPVRSRPEPPSVEPVSERGRVQLGTGFITGSGPLHPAEGLPKVRKGGRYRDHETGSKEPEVSPFVPPVSTDFLEMPMEAERPRRSWRGLAAAGIVLITLTGGGIFAARQFAAPGVPVTTTGTLMVTTNPPGAGVSIDGEQRGLTPLSLTLNAGAHVLEVLGAAGPRTIPVTIAAGTQVSQYIELPAASGLLHGQLQVRTEPSGARVTVDGTPRGVSPITIDNLAPGQHNVALESDFGSVKQDVTIEAGTMSSLLVPLTASGSVPLSGWISISAPVNVQLFENGRLLGTSEIDRIMMPTGRHNIEVANDALGYRVTRTVQVAAGRVTPIAIEVPEATIALNAVPWAQVSIDGKDVGETPIGNLPLPIGFHEVVFRHPELGEQRRTVTVTLTSPLRLSVDLRKK